MIWQRARQSNVMVLNSKSMTNRGSLERLVVETSVSGVQNDMSGDGDQRQGGESKQRQWSVWLEQFF